MSKPSLLKISIAGGVRRLHIFLESIIAKANVLARLEFELGYFEAAIQYFGTYFSCNLGKYI